MVTASIFKGIFQHGPFDGFSEIQLYFIVILVILVPLTIIVVYRLLFPNLQKVKVPDLYEKKGGEENNLLNDTTKDSEVTEFIDPESETVTQNKALLDLVLRVMDADERKIVEALLEADGSMLQKEISWKIGFSRVKTHRVLTRLIRRSVVTAEKYYNTNKIVLSDFLLNQKKRD